MFGLLAVQHAQDVLAFLKRKYRRQPFKRLSFKGMGFIDDQVAVLRQDAVVNHQVGKQQRVVDYQYIGFFQPFQHLEMKALVAVAAQFPGTTAPAGGQQAPVTHELAGELQFFAIAGFGILRPCKNRADKMLLLLIERLLAGQNANILVPAQVVFAPFGLRNPVIAFQHRLKIRQVTFQKLFLQSPGAGGNNHFFAAFQGP